MTASRLHPGPGQSAAEVAADQRARLRGAMTEMVYEGGYPAVTVRELIKRARVSKPTFYKLYGGKEQCFCAAYEEAADASIKSVAAATRESADRADFAERGLRAFAAAVAERPAAAYLGLLETLSAGDVARERMRKSEDDFAGLIRQRFAGLEDGVELPASIGPAIVAGVGRVARERLNAKDAAGFRDDVEELTRWVLTITDPLLLELDAASAHREPRAQRRERSLDPRRLPITAEQALILDATLRLAAEGGYERLTAPNIAELAGVSKRRFDENFASVEECFTRTLEFGVVSVVAEGRAAFESADQWALGVDRALATLCRCFAEEPGLARMTFVEIFVPGRTTTRRGADILTGLAKLMGRRAPRAAHSSDVAAEASVGAMWALCRLAVAAGRGSELPRLAPTLSWVALAPSIGGSSVLELLQDG